MLNQFRLTVTVSQWATALLRLLPAEAAHDLTMEFLERGIGGGLLPLNAGLSWHKFLHDREDWRPLLRTEIPGLGTFDHPIGLAAGLDKNARALGAWGQMGFGFIEVGTVTPRPQPGNPRPRLFRYPERRALINRMGFNNKGIDPLVSRIKAAGTLPLSIGINCGKNKDTPDERAMDDYRLCWNAAKGQAQWGIINISSPNTPGLRGLANPAFLKGLAAEFRGDLRRIWVKLDPDMAKGPFQDCIHALANEAFAGVILTNTHRVEWPEAGGKSGHSLLGLSNTRLEWAWEVHQGQLPMIGCGGVIDGADILQKIMRGAHAVEIYTALIYRGPWVVFEMLEELACEMKLLGVRSVSEARGRFYEERKGR